MEDRMLGGSDAAILPSELAQRALIDAGWRLPSQATVVPCLLSRGSVPGGDLVGETERVIVVVGAVGRLKGSDVMINAAGFLRHLRPTVRFIGSEEPGPLRDAKLPQLKRLAEELGVRCEFLGWRPRDDVARAYAEARVVVVPSRFESFSLVALEAAQAGRPVVISTGAGAAELPRMGAPFEVFPSEDCDALAGLLEPLLADKERAARVGAEGKRFIDGDAYRRAIATGWEDALKAAVPRVTPR
jgi:glycosyltransferase involved in cell wall biosynthesis